MEPGAVRRLLAELRRRPALALAAAALPAVAAAAQLGLALLARSWVDGPVLAGRLDEAPRLLQLSALLLATLALASGLGRWLGAVAGQDLQLGLRTTLHERLLRARIDDLRRRPAGDLLARLGSDTGSLGGFAVALLQAPGDVLLVAGALLAMLLLDPGMALAGLLLVLPVALLADRGGRAVRRRTARAREALGAFAGLLQDQLRGLVTLRVLGAEAAAEQRAATALRDQRQAAIAAHAAGTLLVASVFAVTGAGLLGLLLLQSQRLIAGQVAAGSVVALALCAGQVVEPLRRLGETAAALGAALGAGERVFEVLDGVPREGQGTSTAARTGPAPDLLLDDVRFRHRPDEPLLEGVALRVRPGEPIGLVGPSGCGKSTLLALLPRLVEPQGGRLLLDGCDVRELDLGVLRRRVLLLDDAPFVFSGSLLENLRHGAPGASREEALAAAGRVGLSDLVAQRGPDTPLSGRELSGGQRQRIALARALLRDPGVLLLDEATSALDERSEAVIFDGLRDWLAARTVVVVAHRRASLARLPRLALLERGRIAASGTLEGISAASLPGLFDAHEGRG